MNSEYAAIHPGATTAIGLPVERRARFIMRTYSHVVGAIVAFTLLEVALFTSGIAEPIARFALSTNWLLILGAFMIAGAIASSVAARARTLPMQYLGLAGYVLAEALIFVPMLYIAMIKAPGVIQSAATVTLTASAGLMLVAFWTRKDFSFLGGMLRWAMILALVGIVAAVLFGFELGTWFSVGMIGLAGASVLYETSNILHHYDEERYVGAALALFASIALMFWYVLRLFLSRD